MPRYNFCSVATCTEAEVPTDFVVSNGIDCGTDCSEVNSAVALQGMLVMVVVVVVLVVVVLVVVVVVKVVWQNLVYPTSVQVR